MSDSGVDGLLAQARGAPTIDAALGLTLEAIGRAPAHPDPYGLRALLAVAAQTPGAAAHYFRVAYARGHRALETRMGLSICYGVVGDRGGAEAIARGQAVPRVLEPFEKLAPKAVTEIRRALEGPLPPADTPAWHASDLDRIGLDPRDGVDARTPTSAPPPHPAPSAASTDSASTAPLGPLIDIQVAPQASWLEPVETFHAGPTLGRPNWLEDTAQPSPRDARTGGFVRSLDFVTDPGLPDVAVVSPVTGRSVPVSALDRARMGASVGDFDPPRALLEARTALLPWLDASSTARIALRLPGPVVTEDGQSPSKLCASVILGLTETELVLLDAEQLDTAPARVRLSSFIAMKTVAHGFQVSLALSESKQVHLDFRALQSESSRVANAAIRLIAEALQGQHET